MKNSRQNNWGRSSITNTPRIWKEHLGAVLNGLYKITKEEGQNMAIYIHNLDELNDWVNKFKVYNSLKTVGIFLPILRFDQFVRQEILIKYNENIQPQLDEQ